MPSQTALLVLSTWRPWGRSMWSHSDLNTMYPASRALSPSLKNLPQSSAQPCSLSASLSRLASGHLGGTVALRALRIKSSVLVASKTRSSSCASSIGTGRSRPPR